MIGLVTEGFYRAPTRGVTLINTGGAECGIPDAPIVGPVGANVIVKPLAAASVVATDLLAPKPQVETVDPVQPSTDTLIAPKPIVDDGDDC